MLLTGWAVSSGGVAAVEVDIDGQIWPASYGRPSPDIAANIEGAKNARFTLRVDTAQLANGAHRVKVRARSNNGDVAVQAGLIHVERYEVISWRPQEQLARIENGQPVMSCDIDLSGDTPVRVPRYLRGWAHARHGIARVALFVDGRHRIEAVTGIRRPDSLRNENMQVTGFQALLDGAILGLGRRSIVTIAYPIEGHPIGMSGWLNLVQGVDGSGPIPIVADTRLLSPPIRLWTKPNSTGSPGSASSGG
jgi:hypothetical protein